MTKTIILILSRTVKLIQRAWWIFTIISLVIVFMPSKWYNSYFKKPVTSVTNAVKSMPQIKMINHKTKKIQFSKQDVLKINSMY